jgi:hypothetical protein
MRQKPPFNMERDAAFRTFDPSEDLQRKVQRSAVGECHHTWQWHNAGILYFLSLGVVKECSVWEEIGAILEDWLLTHTAYYDQPVPRVFALGDSLSECLLTLYNKVVGAHMSTLRSQAEQGGGPPPHNLGGAVAIVPKTSRVSKNGGLSEAFMYKNESFTKIGSGQT